MLTCLCQGSVNRRRLTDWSASDQVGSNYHHTVPISWTESMPTMTDTSAAYEGGMQSWTFSWVFVIIIWARTWSRDWSDPPIQVSTIDIALDRWLRVSMQQFNNLALKQQISCANVVTWLCGCELSVSCLHSGAENTSHCRLIHFL